MRNLHYTLWLFLGLFFTNSMIAQEECGAVVPESTGSMFLEVQEEWEDYKREYQENVGSRDEMVIPVKLHIIRTSQKDKGIPPDKAMKAIEFANQDLAAADVRLDVCGDINFIDDDKFHVFDTLEEDDLVNEHYVENMLNIFIPLHVMIPHPSGIDLYGSKVGGYASFPWQQDRNIIMLANGATIVNNQGNLQRSSTLPHEVGHFLGLLHTHHKSINIPKEHVTRTGPNRNCETAGDCLCSTPADPRLASSQTSNDPTKNNVSDNCTYLGGALLTDAFGEPYTPATRNMMSYSKNKCREIWTEEQYARMRFFYEKYYTTLSCNANTPGGGNNNPNPPTPPTDSYCVSSSSQSFSGYISKVQFLNINNTSNWEDGYGDFSSQNGVANLGQSYSIQLTPSTGNPSNLLFWKAWIDFNQNNEFEISERVLNAQQFIQNEPVLNRTIQIPANAMTGKTRMRIVLGVNTQPDPCGSYVSGETEDYSVELSMQLPPPPVVSCTPKGLNTNIGYIASVGFGSLDYSSGNSGGLGEYLDKIAQVDVGGTFDLNLTQNANSGGTKRWKAWIDWNQDMDFDDAGEMVASGTTRWFAPTLTTPIMIPDNAKLGETRMRIIMSGYYNIDNPCDDVIYGEVENYSVQINKSYCGAKGTDSSFEWIDQVRIKTSNGGAFFENKSGNNGGYGDYRNEYIPLQQDVDYPLVLVPGFNGGGPYNEVWSVWVDLNIDGDFNDAGELIYRTPAATMETVETTISIPSSAKLGDTRMRVAMHFPQAIFDIAPCGDVTYGEFEDYTVNIAEMGNADILDYWIDPFSEIPNPHFEGEAKVEPRGGFDMSIYPNPTRGISRLKLELGAPRETQINVFNITGQLVQTIDLSEIQYIDFHLDLGDLARGTYLVRVQGEDFSETKRIVVLK